MGLELLSQTNEMIQVDLYGTQARCMYEIAPQGESHDRQSDATKLLGNKQDAHKRSDVKGSPTGLGRRRGDAKKRGSHNFQVKVIEGNNSHLVPSPLVLFRIFLPHFPPQPQENLG